jgi:integrase
MASASIRKRKDRPSSPWEARWREYPGGPQSAKSFRRKIDAERHLTKVRHDLLTGTYIAPEAAAVTLGDYVATHLARQPWADATRDIAANGLGHALRFFGQDRPVASVRKADVQAFVTGLELAPSTVKVVHQHLHTLLAAAVDDRLVVVNSAKGVRLPRGTAGEVVPPSAEEVAALYEAAPDWFRVAVVEGAGLGLRQGEASGLTGDRVDWLGEQTVRVDRQWRTRRRPHQFAPPKSEASHRSIPAPPDVLDELAASVTGPDGFVLHRQGQPVDHHAFAYAWRQTVRRAGLEPGLRFHALRHRFASVLISAGCSIVAVQRMMGHSSPTITLNLYSHLMPSDSDRVRQALTGLFNPAEDQVRTSAIRAGV